jgi:hypothetical protein
MVRHYQGQPRSEMNSGGNAGGWRGGGPPNQHPSSTQHARGSYAPVQPMMAPGMAPMYAQGQMHPTQGQEVQLQYQYQPEQMSAPPGYVVAQAPGGQLVLQAGVQAPVLVAPQGYQQGYQQIAVVPQVVVPGQAGTFFAGMRPQAAQPHSQAYGYMTTTSDTGYGGQFGGAESHGQHGSGYGGGGRGYGRYGRGRGGDGYDRHRRGNRYDALRDPRSRR